MLEIVPLVFGSSVRVSGSAAAGEGDGLVGMGDCMVRGRPGGCMARVVRGCPVGVEEYLVGEALGGPEECSLLTS